MIEDATAEDLLPDLPYWQRGQDGAAPDGAQVAPAGLPVEPQQHPQQLQQPPQQQQAQQPPALAMQAAGMPAATAVMQPGQPPQLPLAPGADASQPAAPGAAPSGLHPLQRRQLEQQRQQHVGGMPLPLQQGAQPPHPVHGHPQALQQHPTPAPGLPGALPSLHLQQLPPQAQGPQPWRPQQQPRPPGGYPSLPTRR